MNSIQMIKTGVLGKGLMPTAKRQSSINTMSDMFDRRIDYILGYSDDPTSPKLTQEQIEELGKWEIQSEQIDVIRQFLRLDAYGRMNVKTLIQREFLRCLEQGTDQDISNIKIGIKTISEDNA